MQTSSFSHHTRGAHGQGRGGGGMIEMSTTPTEEGGGTGGVQGSQVHEKCKRLLKQADAVLQSDKPFM